MRTYLNHRHRVVWNGNCRLNSRPLLNFRVHDCMRHIASIFAVCTADIPAVAQVLCRVSECNSTGATHSTHLSKVNQQRLQAYCFTSRKLSARLRVSPSTWRLLLHGHHSSYHLTRTHQMSCIPSLCYRDAGRYSKACRTLSNYLICSSRQG